MKLILTFTDNSKRTVDIPDATLMNLTLAIANAEDEQAMIAARKTPKAIEKAP